MQFLCSTEGVVSLDYLGMGMKTLVGGGFSDLLLNVTSYAFRGDALEEEEDDDLQKRGVFDDPGKLRNILRPLLKAVEKNHLSVRATYANFTPPNQEFEGDLADSLMKLGAETLHIAARAGSKYLVIRPPVFGLGNRDVWEFNREFYLSLAAAAKENDITILLENQCRDVNSHLIRGLCSDEAEAIEWVDSLNEAAGEERFGFSLDVGTCNLCAQSIRDVVVALGNRLKMLILRDCDGHEEAALLPFTSAYRGASQTDWRNLIRGLREIDFDGVLAMDIKDTVQAIPTIVKPQIIAIAKSLAEYMSWQVGQERVLKKYSSRVLFGAGNMCKNYMEAYGQKYPPLYTCDNAKHLWHTKCEGLDVKPPDELKNLPPDCAIFICNMYYGEIEEQLRDMGLENPVERFSDEYL